MFTGIIEAQAKINAIQKDGSNIDFRLEVDFLSELKVDQSVSHDGVCLTVTNINTDEKWYEVSAIQETLLCSNLGEWKIGQMINVERCLVANGRFDGHVVQGHVDATGRVEQIENKAGSWEFTISHEVNNQNITVGKGSICVNGVSLTVVLSEPGRFSVAIIPFTHENTGFNQLTVGDKVNLEFDIIGKYVQRLLNT